MDIITYSATCQILGNVNYFIAKTVYKIENILNIYEHVVFTKSYDVFLSVFLCICVCGMHMYLCGCMCTPTYLYGGQFLTL